VFLKSIYVIAIALLSASFSFAQSTAAPAANAAAPTAATAAPKTTPPAAASAPKGTPISPELTRQIANTIRSYYSDSLPPTVDLTIGNRYPSEVAGFDMLHVEFSQGDRHRTNDFLLAKDGNALVRWLKIDMLPDPMSQIDVKGRPIRGNKDAKVTIVSFDDFECPYCSKMHQTLFPDLAKTYGDRIRIIYKDYPLDQMHPWAIHAAVNANCLAAQNGNAYWEFADLVHADQKKIDGDRSSKTKSTDVLDKSAGEIGNKYFVNATLLQQCIQKQDERAVRASMAEGDKLGVNATPTLFINGERMEGAAPEDALRTVIDHALKAAGVEPPPQPVKSASEAPPEKKAPAGTTTAPAPANK
jgi:protein-disulfide isomerase